MNQPFVKTSWMMLWGSALALVSTVGCMPTSFVNSSLITVPTKVVPEEIVVTAQPSWIGEPGEPRHAGMLCRLYFFEKGDPVPIEVSGDLTVVAFEEKETSAAVSTAPNGLYRISADTLAKHHRQDVVGHCYVFWFQYEVNEPARLRVQAKLQTKPDKAIESSWLRLTIDPKDDQPADRRDAPASSTEHAR